MTRTERITRRLGREAADVLAEAQASPAIVAPSVRASARRTTAARRTIRNGQPRTT